MAETGQRETAEVGAPGVASGPGHADDLHQLHARGRRSRPKLYDAITRLGGDVWMDARALAPVTHGSGDPFPHP